jgi:hypothetical protein
MLYTIAQAAKAMAVEQSIILKAIEGGHITATKDGSGEWHVEDGELNLLYLYLARNYCKQHLQTDAQKMPASSQEPQIINIAGGRVEQERRKTRRGADRADAAPIMSPTTSTWQDEIRIDDGTEFLPQLHSVLSKQTAFDSLQLRCHWHSAALARAHCIFSAAFRFWSKTPDL